MSLATRLSSSSSSFSLSPERAQDVPSEIPDDMEKVCIIGDSNSAFPPADLGLQLSNPDTDFPRSRSEGLPFGGATPDFYPPQSRLSGKFPGTKSTGRA